MYSGHSLFSWLIKKKTYSQFTHVALYIGEGKQREFREFVGAQEVPLQTDNLVMIRRPKGEWRAERSQRLWDQVKTQGYDYVGLFLTFIAVRRGASNKKMWCSEFYARDHDYSVDGEPLFSEVTDADTVAPSDCVKSSGTRLIWGERHD